MRRKLMPAIYFLAEQKLLPAQFALLGVGRDAMEDAAFAQTMRDALNKSDEIETVNEETWAWLSARIRYAYGDLTSRDAYESIGSRLNDIELSLPLEQRNRLFYLSIPPCVFETTL